MRHVADAEVRRTDERVPLSRTATPAEIRQAYEDVAEQWAETMGTDAPESWIAWTIEDDGELLYHRVRIGPPEGSSAQVWDLDTGEPQSTEMVHEEGQPARWRNTNEGNIVFVLVLGIFSVVALVLWAIYADASGDWTHLPAHAITLVGLGVTVVDRHFKMRWLYPAGLVLTLIGVLTSVLMLLYGIRAGEPIPCSLINEPFRGNVPSCVQHFQ